MSTTSNESRTARMARAPRRTNNEQQLKKIYQRYVRMGFTPQEARFKAFHYHTMKL